MKQFFQKLKFKSNLLCVSSGGILLEFGKGSSNSRYESGKYSAARTDISVDIKLFYLISGVNVSFMINQVRTSFLFFKNPPKK